MDVLLPSTEARLDAWAARAVATGVAEGPGSADKRDRYARIVGTEPPGSPLPGGPFRRAAGAILRYRVFPPTLIAGVLARAPLQVGDTVGIRYRGFRVVHLFFAARVAEVFDGPHEGGWRAGFTYETLRGHPELGAETFAVYKRADGLIEVSLTAWSRPGTWLARLFPFVVRALQVRGSRAALDHLTGVASGR